MMSDGRVFNDHFISRLLLSLSANELRFRLVLESRRGISYKLIPNV